MKKLLETFKQILKEEFDWRLTIQESENKILAQQEQVMPFSGQTVSAICFIEPYGEEGKFWKLKTKNPANRDDIFETMKDDLQMQVFKHQEGKFYCITNAHYEIR